MDLLAWCLKSGMVYHWLPSSLSAQKCMALQLWAPKHCMLCSLSPLLYACNAMLLATIHPISHNFSGGHVEYVPLYLQAQ